LSVPAILTKLKKIPAVPVISRNLRILAQQKLNFQNEINMTKYAGILYPGSVRCYSRNQHQRNVEPSGGNIKQYLDYLERLNFFPQNLSIITKLFGFLNESDYISPNDARIILKVCNAQMSLRPEEKIRNLHKAWGLLEKKGVEFDISHFNTILQTYVENEHVFQPPEFLEKISKSQLEPNKIIYEYLMYAYCQMGDLSGAMKILEHVKQQDMSVSNLVFEGLIIGHAKNGDMEKASDVISLMKDSQLKPTANTYKTLASVQAEAGDMEAVKKTIALAEENYQRFTSSHLMDIIFSFAKKGFTEHAETILSESDKHGPFYYRNLNQLIYQLMNAGCFDLAAKVYNYFPDKSRGNNWYLDHMVKCGMPLEEVMKIAEDMQMKTKDEFMKGLLRCDNYFERSLEVLKFVEEKGGLEIRLQYYFPLIATSVAFDYEGLSKIMSEIGKRNFEMDADSVDFLVSSLLMSKLTDLTICNLLQEAGCKFIMSVNKITQRLLRNNEFERAFIFIGNTGNMLTRNTTSSLVFALTRNNNYLSTCKALNHFREGSGAVDLFVKECMKRTGNVDKSRNIDKSSLIENLVKTGVVLPQETVDWLHNNAENFQVSHLRRKIDLLSRNDRPVWKFEPNMKEENYSTMVGNLVENMKREGASSGRLILTFQYFMRELKMDEAESLFKELVEANCVTNGQYVSMLTMYAELDLADKAMEMFNKLHEMAGSDLVIDRRKVVLLAKALVNSDRISEALELLEKEGEKFNEPERMYDENYKRNIRTFMKSLSVKSQDPEILDKFVHTMVEKDYYPKESGIGFFPIATFLVDDRSADIWEYTQENDTLAAFERVKKYFEMYKILPLRFVLMRSLFRLNDQKRVEELCSMISKVFSEEESLFVMLGALMSENRSEDAIQLLKDNEKWIRSHMIISKFKYYLNSGRISEAENLLSITLHVATINRIELFESLLGYYDSKNDYESGLQLWNRMQEEAVLDSVEFRNKLAKLLMRNGKKSPFPVSEIQKVEKDQKSVKDDYSDLFNLLSDEKLDQYAEALNRLSVEEVSSAPLELISILTEKGQTDLAFQTLKRISVDGKRTRLVNSSPLARKLLIQTKNGGYFDRVKQVYLTAPQDNNLHKWLCLHASTEEEKNEVLEMTLEKKHFSFGLYAVLHDSPQRMAKVEEALESLEFEDREKLKRALWVAHVIKGDTCAAEQNYSTDFKPWKATIDEMIYLNIENIPQSIWNIPGDDKPSMFNHYLKKLVDARDFENAKECIAFCEQNGMMAELNKRTLMKLERRMQGAERRLERETSNVEASE